MDMDDDGLDYSHLLEDTRSVSYRLETLRNQHETQLSELSKNNNEEEEGKMI